MTITVEERKETRSVPWENALYPTLRTSATAWEYLEMATDEPQPGEVCLALHHVIEANKDIPFIAYQVICAYSSHLTVDDIPLLVETLQGLDQVYQEYLSDLCWWLNMLKETLVHGLHWIQVEAKILDMPDELKANEAYQQWAKVA